MALNVKTSIVDYLKSIGQDSSFTARQALAKQYGITNYKGTAEQNVKLLQTLRTGATPTQATPTQSTAQPIQAVQPDTTSQTAQQTPGEYNLPPLDTGNVPENYSLPTADISNLSSDQALAFALRDVARLAEREGKVTGTAAASTFFANRGIMPEDLPGSSVANMLAVVDRAMVSPVAERTESITDLINAISLQRQELQNTMATQLKFMMDMGNWNSLIETDPIQAQNLWRGAGFIGSPQSITEKAGFSAPYYNEEGQLVQTDEATGQVRVIADRQSTPASYREWELAGGLKGTGMTYNEWLTKTATSAGQLETSYQMGFLADKEDGMSYEEAIQNYGSHINRSWIDWIYIEAPVEVERLQWIQKAQDEPDKYVIKEDGIYENKWFGKLLYSFK